MWDEVLSCLSSRQDTASPTDTACSSESPAFLGPSSIHLLLYDQNSSEEELEVINGAAGDVGSCNIAQVSGASAGDQLPGGGDEEDEDDDATEEIAEEEDEDDKDYVSPVVGGPTTMTTMTPTTIIGSAAGGPMDTGGRGQFVSLAGVAGASDVSLEDVFAEDGAESLDEYANELCLASNPPHTQTLSGAASNASAGDKRFNSSLLEKRKRSLAQNSDDEVRYLLEQQQQATLPTHPQQHSLPAHHHHHHHHSMRQSAKQQHLHQEHLHHPEEALLSAPVNFRTSPPLEALKPHRGHILQRSTTPLILTEGGGACVGPPGATDVGGVLSYGGGGLLGSGSRSSLSSLGGGCVGSAGSGSGFYGPGLVGGGTGGLRFTLGRRPIGCDSPLTAVSHRNSTNQYGGGSNSLGSGLSTTTRTTTRASSSSSSSSSLSSTSSLAISGGGRGGGSPGSVDPCPLAAVAVEQQQQRSSGGSASVVTNMDVSRSVSPPAKMFHCAVSPRRRQPRHQQQRLQRPHRPCLDFDKMQQLKARSVTTWRHSNEHSGELSVFCW
ncbi:AT-rich interactive domain-containing protein 1B isoform X2 [Anopheles bellator]|uniref:AT-rich interactive domain-containing protein 1B isoform X2 n=1 Tax=Anopheles bellator TaxID=139047 RepID=UPI002647E4F1|nr:AT-rich interactive domain-containing protein 1B isoform X2 [Anopheles bellator]